MGSESNFEEDFNDITELIEKIYKQQQLRHSFMTSQSELTPDLKKANSFDEIESVEIYLRDSLIKAFMIIFTNE